MFSRFSSFSFRPGKPDIRPRQISFLVQDDRGRSSPGSVVDLTFRGINDPPVLSLNGFTQTTRFQTTFKENGAAVPVSVGREIELDGEGGGGRGQDGEGGGGRGQDGEGGGGRGQEGTVLELSKQCVAFRITLHY